MSELLPYDPGNLPTAPAPSAGEKITIRVDGLPPYKDEHFSIRNPRHTFYSRFSNLRSIAIHEMEGRAPYRGPIKIDFIMHSDAYDKDKTLIDYVGGIQDSLDGSHGFEFTYLPIVFEDDCQICDIISEFNISKVQYYQITIYFLLTEYR